jgi:hypothetical protein
MEPGFIQQHLLMRSAPEGADLLFLAPKKKVSSSLSNNSRALIKATVGSERALFELDAGVARRVACD